MQSFLVPAGHVRCDIQRIAPHDIDNPVVVNVDADFNYVMRSDATYAAKRISARNIDGVLHAYRRFECRLQRLFLHSTPIGSTATVYWIEAEDISHAMQRSVDNWSVISLDPLYTGPNFPLEISRCFALDGRHSLGHVARPGALSIAQQIDRLCASLRGRTATVLVDDDVFSGESVRFAKQVLERNDISVEAIFVGSAVGTLPEDVSALVEFTTQREGTVVETFDPRNFLIGVGGLVVALPSGRCGRVPYFLPYVSPRERSTVAGMCESEFSRRVIHLNLQFFEEIETPLRLRDLDTPFIDAMSELHGWSGDESLSAVLRSMLAELVVVAA